MFNVVIDQDAQVCAWVEEHYNVKFVPPLRALGITRNGETIGAAIFNNFEGANIELSCVGKGAFNRTVCRLIAQTAFMANECERITIKVRADNAYVIKTAIKFGWRVEGTLRRYYGDVDCIIFGMLKDECRFLR